MSNVEVLRFGTADDLAAAVAKAWLTFLEIAVASGPVLVALSGGRIARNLFSEAASLFGAEGKQSPPMPPRPLQTTHFFWGDERCVPPEDPESNFGIARKLLLEPLRIPENQIHRIRGEAPAKVAAAEAAGEVRRIARPAAAGQPLIDLIFLGMGEDGHVASLFPDEPDTAFSNPMVYRAVTASKPPPQRITLGYQTIAAAREVWVLASGAGKEQALRNSLSKSGTTPLARVLRMRLSTRIFTDVAS